MLQQLQYLASDNTWLPDLSAIRIFSKNRRLKGCNVLFAESQVEDCLELNFRYVDYHPLTHLSYSSYVCCCACKKSEMSLKCPSIS